MHILVNNSGGPPAGPLASATVDAFLDAYRRHLIANHVLAESVIPGMRASGYGRIVNVISTSVKEPIPNLGVSNTTRGAVASWAKTLADGTRALRHHRQQRTARLDEHAAHRANPRHRAKATGKSREEISPR